MIKYLNGMTWLIIFAAQNFEGMEQAKKSTGKHWALFFFWTALMFVIMFSPYGQWFWLILPFVVTEFAKAMDIM